MAVAFCIQAQNPLGALLPMPNKISLSDATADLNLGHISVFQSNLLDTSPVIKEFKLILNKRLNHNPLTIAKSGAKIVINIDTILKGQEHYTIKTDKNSLIISGASEAALFRAMQTLDQILLGDAVRTTKKCIAQLFIDDSPRYERRILMLDPARNFLPVEDVKRYINEMAKYKFNVLQLHLTDNEGWRFQVKSHPELTSNGKFYSHDDLKDLIKYAEERFIEIVPELDIPGHTIGILNIHPEFACTFTDSVAIKKAGGAGGMLCASQSGVYNLYKDIIKEVAEVFPSKYIHLGGDEAVLERNWGICDLDRKLMKELGYSKPADLMNYFFERMLSFVRNQGKHPILWCELDNIYMPANDYLFPYPKDVVLVTWRMGLTPKCQELTSASGHTLIMAPGEYAYFDYPQYKNDFPEFNNWGMPMTTLQKAYELDPGTNANIQGVMGTLWGEAIPDINRASYMTYPRALALAEAGWSQMRSRNWNSFKERLIPVLGDMLSRGVSYRAPFEIYR